MDTFQILILLGACGLLFALLLKVQAIPLGASSAGAHKTTETLVAGLAAINLTGALGLGWFAARMLFYDGVMAVELSICAVLIAVLTGLTGGAYTLKRRGRIGAAIAMLLVAALPTIAVFGFLLYLDSHPIDMR